MGNSPTTAPSLLPTEVQGGAGGGGLFGGGINPTAVQWQAQQQQRYNQVTQLANFLNWAATSGQMPDDLAHIAGGQYLRFIGEKDPYKALPKYAQWLQETLQAHQIGSQARQGQQNPNIIQPGPQPPPGMQSGGKPAALPATPNGQVGANPQAGQLPTTVNPSQLPPQQLPTVAPPPGSNMPQGFGIGWETELNRARATQMIPKEAEIAAAQQQFHIVLSQLTNGHEDQATPQQRVQAMLMSTPKQLGYMPGAFFTAQAQQARYGYNEDGSPKTYDQLSPEAKTRIELEDARAFSQNAQSELDRAKAATLTDPNNPRLKAEVQRMLMLTKIAGDRLSLAQQGMALRTAEFGANYDPSVLTPQQQKNMALPTDEDNQAVGYKSPLAPGAAQRHQQYQADVVDIGGQNLINLISQNRDKLGNMQAIINSAFLGTPMADPASQRIAAAIGSYAATNPAMHGFKGQRAYNEFLHLIGGLPSNPDALIAGIQGIQGTARVVEGATPKTRTTRGTPAPPPGSQQLIYARDPQGKLHKAPAGTKLPQGWKAENAPATQ